MAIGREEFEEMFSKWSYIPEEVKIRMMNYEKVIVTRTHNDLFFSREDGVLLYRVYI